MSNFTFLFICDLFSIEGETINITTIYKMGLGARGYLLYQGLINSIQGLCKTETEMANTNKYIGQT